MIILSFKDFLTLKGCDIFMTNTEVESNEAYFYLKKKKKSISAKSL